MREPQRHYALLLFTCLCMLGLAGPLTETNAAESWQNAQVPGNWEQTAGATDYDGFAWYRCRVRTPDRWSGNTPTLWNESVTLTVADIADAYEVFVNGQKIGGAGALPPQFKSGKNESHRYKVPRGLLQPSANNVIALRVYNHQGAGGFLGRAPVIAGYFLECELKGEWQFRTGDDPQWSQLAVPEGVPVFSKFGEATTVLSRTAKLTPGPRLPPADSLARMTTSEELQVEQVLAEPIVAQPLFMTFDERGRLWVVQYRQYPYPAGLQMVSRDKYYRAVYDKVPPAPPHHFHGDDRITIHEDTDGDGTYDNHKVFLDGLSITTAIAHGRGGVWVLNPPYLMFYPDADHDDVPDAAPVVHLSGFGLQDTHSVANSLEWGPDGWLYGAHGSTVSSHIARPGSQDEPTYCEGAAIWRYRPSTKEFEIFAEGGGNAFGLEIDAQGRVYSGHNGGNTRGFHYRLGGYYTKGGSHKYGPVSNPYAFGNIPYMEHAPVSRFTHSFVRYEENALPDTYHGKMFCADPLHNNIVLARMEARGSSYATVDEGFPLSSEDTSFRPVNIKTGPDGAIYVADFYEHYIAHGQHFQGQIDPGSGRVYRLRTKGSSPQLVDLSKHTTRELVALLSHPGKWYRRTALRLIADRQDSSVIPALQSLLANRADQTALEALWACYQLGALDEASAIKCLEHKSPFVRLWTVQLMCDGRMLTEHFREVLCELADRESHAEVRCQLAASARRLPGETGLKIAHRLYRHDQDVADPQIPLMLWWLVEANAATHTDTIQSWFEETEFWRQPLVAQHLTGRIMRRFAAGGTQEGLLACARLLELSPDDASSTALLRGFEDAQRGLSWSSLPTPLLTALKNASGASPMIRIHQRDPAAIADALQTLADSDSDVQTRLQFAQVFGEVIVPTAEKTLTSLLAEDNEAMVIAALNSLRQYDSLNIGRKVVQRFDSFSQDAKTSALLLLGSRRAWSELLLDAVGRDQIPANEIPIDVLRMMAFHGDDLKARVQQRWPEVDAAVDDAATRKRVQQLAATLQAGTGNPYSGHLLFKTTCGKCHRLFGKGGDIGPDLSPYKRDDTVRMLLNVVAPSMEIRKGFETFLAVTSDGRTLSGFLVDEDKRVIVLRSLDGTDTVLARDEIDELITQPRSIMPTGLLDKLSPQQLRDLFAYLRSGQPIE